MSKKSGGGSTQTVQKADPWSGVQPALSQLYGAAGEWFQQHNPQYYPESTVATMAPETQTALQHGTIRALNGSPLVTAAKAQNQGTIGGNYLDSNPSNPYFRQASEGGFLDSNPSNDYFDSAAGGAYLGSNPYLDAMFASATNPLVSQYKNAIAPGLASQFSQAGRMGSGSHLQAVESSQEPLAQGLASAAANIYGSAYEAERARQQQAAQILGGNQQFERNLQHQAAGALGSNYNIERGLQEAATQFAPQLANQDYVDLEKLMGVGMYKQDHAQRNLDDQVARWDFNQNRQLGKLQAFNALLQGGNAFGTTSTNQKNDVARNPFMGAVGGAFAGNALGSMAGAGFGPLGMAAGAILGGLFG